MEMSSWELRRFHLGCWGNVFLFLLHKPSVLLDICYSKSGSLGQDATSYSMFRTVGLLFSLEPSVKFIIPPLFCPYFQSLPYFHPTNDGPHSVRWIVFILYKYSVMSAEKFQSTVHSSASCGWIDGSCIFLSHVHSHKRVLWKLEGYHSNSS